MRVCVIVPGFSSDASDWCIPVIRSIVDRLARSVEVVVVTPHYPFRKQVYTIGPIEVHCLSDRKSSGPARLALWRKTVQYIVDLGRERPFTAIHAFWGTETGWLATVAARRLGIRSIVTLAGGEMASLPQQGYGSRLRLSGRLLVNRSLERADRLTAGSTWMINLLPESHRSRTVRLPLGVDTDQFTAAPARHGRQLLAVSSLYPWKDLVCVIRAVARVVPDIPDLSLRIVGTGVLRESLATLAHDLAISDHVEFSGEVRYEVMPEVYHGADRLVHAGLYESQGMVILEALATGLPVVASRVGIAADLEDDLTTTFDPGNVDQLAHAIRRSLEDRNDAERIAGIAPRRIAEDYSLDRCATEFLGLYSS